MENTEYAGFWIRFGATLIDGVIMSIIFVIPMSFIYGDEYWLGTKLVHGFWDVMFTYILPCIATIWFWLRFMGTPGKMATQLKIVDASTGNQIGLDQAVIRYFGYILSAIPVGLGFLWVAIDERKQGWHDKLAGTVVIRDTGKTAVKFDSDIF